MLELKAPREIGITKGGADNIFDSAAITAVNATVLVLLSRKFMNLPL